MYNKQIEELKRIAGLSREEAKRILLQQLDKSLNDEKAALIKSVETSAKETANKKAKEIAERHLKNDEIIDEYTVGHYKK